jgi:hypothetical protein
MDLGELMIGADVSAQPQALLSLDSIMAEDIHQILPGFHKHLDDWRISLGPRSSAVSGRIVPDKLLTHKLCDDHKITWTSVRYGPGDVYFTRPDIPRRVPDHSSIVCRFLFPCLIGLQTDYSASVLAKEGLIPDIGQVYRERRLPAHTPPAGNPSLPDQGPYGLQSDLMLGEVTSIGGALTGQRKWDSYDVLTEVRTLLLEDPDRVEEIVKRARRVCLQKAVFIWQKVKAAEKHYYKTDSFFYQQEAAIKRGS